MRRLILVVCFLVACDELTFKYEPCVDGIKTIEYKKYLTGSPEEGYVTSRVECRYDELDRPITIHYYDLLEGDASKGNLVEIKTLNYYENKVVIRTSNLLDGGSIEEEEVLF